MACQLTVGKDGLSNLTSNSFYFRFEVQLKCHINESALDPIRINFFNSHLPNAKALQIQKQIRPSSCSDLRNNYKTVFDKCSNKGKKG